jgi:hypothetical protein
MLVSMCNYDYISLFLCIYMLYIYMYVQTGIGVAAGPESLLALGKALATLYADDAFCALDMHNSFGEVSRAEVMEEVLSELPEIANFLMNMWGETGTPHPYRRFDSHDAGWLVPGTQPLLHTVLPGAQARS